MRELTDHLNRTVQAPEHPQRIVSLCPSITETLFELGLGERIAGLTRYCLHPAQQVAKKTDVGGTKRLRHDDIAALQPDLIIAEKEENTREDVNKLQAHYPVYVTEVTDYASALQMILDLGDVCGCQSAARTMAIDIDARFTQLPRLAHPPRTAYMIWRKPWMCVGAGTYIDATLQRCGFDNLFRNHPSGSRYPQLEVAELQQASPELVLLSSEPFPFKQKHIVEMQSILPDADIRLVDGEMFSWYGARMLSAAAYLGNLMTALAS